MLVEHYFFFSSWICWNWFLVFVAISPNQRWPRPMPGRRAWSMSYWARMRWNNCRARARCRPWCGHTGVSAFVFLAKRHPWNGRLIKWIPWNYYCWWILYYCQTSFKAVVCDGWCIFVLNIGVAKCMGRKEASETLESCWEKLCSYLLFSKNSHKEI